MSSIRDYVLNHALFCHHDHTRNYADFDAERNLYTFQSLLGYAVADLVTAEGTRAPNEPMNRERLTRLWPAIRTTGYGRAVVLGCRQLFGLEYAPENWDAISEALRELLKRPTPELYEHCVHQVAQNDWTLHDGRTRVENPNVLRPGLYPASYRFAFRMDELFYPVDAGPIAALERFTGRSVQTLAQFVDAMNAAITLCAESDAVSALKVGMAYSRDLNVGDPSTHEAETAFARIRQRKTSWDGIQQNTGAVDSAGSRALGDYMFHRFLQRAQDDDLPVQIHTGYLAGNWGALASTRALYLIPLLERYRRVRFDLFHASWPWASELGAIAKNYPNVWPDLCWAWAMNPAESERALSEWLDGVPFTRIFGYGADTQLPWCNVGYAIQAKLGIARVLEAKIDAGYMDQHTAEEVADHILLRNGIEFFGLRP